MVTCMETEVQIQDPRNHSAETVFALRSLLAGGANVVPDPKRKGFYEVKSGSIVYYIHVSPINRNVLLLATWPSGDEQSGSGQAA
jgi:hypothetical protein